MYGAYRVYVLYVGYFPTKKEETQLDITRNARIVTINGIQYYHVSDGSNDGAGRYFTLQGEEVEYSSIYPEALTEDKFDLFAKTGAKLDTILELNKFLKRYIYLPNDAEYTMISLLIIHSYGVDLFDRTPYLWIKGAKGSGKTTLMTIMKHLVYSPEFLSDTTAAALFRILDTQPTLFLDEVEALNKRNSGNELIFRVLNSGYQKDGTVTRTLKNIPVIYRTYGFKVLAGINSLAPALQDRCIPLTLTKPPKNIELDTFLVEESTTLSNMVSLIHTSLRKNCADLAKYKNQPELLSISSKIRLREFDKWFPILALAKTFSSKTNNYFRQIQDYALDVINLKEQAEAFQPENICKDIIKDFVADNLSNALATEKNHLFFRTNEIQKVIIANDQFNTYRGKAEITITLKTIGVETTRKRFGNGPVSLYKIPRSILN